MVALRKINFSTAATLQQWASIFWVMVACIGCSYSYAQPTADIQGYYTGELRLTGRGVSMGLQLDITRNGNEYIGVLRSRYMENNKLVGCDNFLAGTLEKDVLTFKQLVPLRETNVPAGTCNYFGGGRISFATKDGTLQAKGSLIDQDRLTTGRLTLVQQDAENSFAFADEMLEAFRLVKEAEITKKAKNPTALADAIYTNRPKNMVDTLYATAGQSISMQISAPEADLFHKLSVAVNGNVALLNRAPRQQPLQLTLPDLPKGEIEVSLLCQHAAVDITYMVNVQITMPDGAQKQMQIPVSTFANRTVLIKVE